MFEINGARVLALIPVIGAEEILYFVIVAQNERETFTACINTTSDREWYWGHYFTGTGADTLVKALANATQRASGIERSPLSAANLADR